MKLISGAMWKSKYFTVTIFKKIQFRLSKSLIFAIILFVKFDQSNAAAHSRLTASGFGTEKKEEHPNLFGGLETSKPYSKRSDSSDSISSSSISTGDNAMLVANKPNTHFKKLTSSSEEMTKIYESSSEIPINMDQHVKERKVEPARQEIPMKRIPNQHFPKLEQKEIDKLYMQDVIAARKDAIRYNIRNTSVFHIDNHNDSSIENTGDTDNENFNFIQKVIILRKPFHFHIPILTHDQLEEVAEEIQNDRQLESSTKISNSNGVYGQGQTETLRDKRLKIPDMFGNTNLNRKHFSPSSFGSIDYPELGMEVYKRHNRHLSAGDKDDNDKVATEYEEENDSVEDENKFMMLKRNQSKVSSGFHHKFDSSNEWAYLDALLRQHPKLVPSVNRKRNSGNHVKEFNYDEVWPHLPELSEPHPDVMAIKRELKQLDFSQNLIGSILNHRDDFEEYHQKMWELASKLGIRPLEVFHAIMQGKLDQSGMTKNHTKKVHERIYDIRSFLENVDEESRKESPLENHMKIEPVKRTKRGLMNWLKKVFGKTTTTSTTKATTSVPSENVNDTPILIKLKKVHKKTSFTEKFESSSENGDTTFNDHVPNELHGSEHISRHNLHKIEEYTEEEEDEKSMDKKVKVHLLTLF